MKSPLFFSVSLAAFAVAGCMDNGATLEVSDVEASAWAGSDLTATLYFREVEALEDRRQPVLRQLAAGDITPDEAEVTLTRQRLPVERLRLEILNGPDAPDFVARLNASEGRRLTLPELITLSEGQIEADIRRIAGGRRHVLEPILSLRNPYSPEEVREILATAGFLPASVTSEEIEEMLGSRVGGSPPRPPGTPWVSGWDGPCTDKKVRFVWPTGASPFVELRGKPGAAEITGTGMNLTNREAYQYTRVKVESVPPGLSFGSAASEESISCRFAQTKSHTARQGFAGSYGCVQVCPFTETVHAAKPTKTKVDDIHLHGYTYECLSLCEGSGGRDVGPRGVITPH